MEVTSVTLPTYEENLKRACWAEESIQRKSLYAQWLQQGQMQARTPSPGQYQHQQHSPQRQYQQWYLQQAKRPKSGQPCKVYCVHCRKDLHPSTDCRWKSRACFGCGTLSHQRRDYPRSQEQGVRNTAPRPPMAAQPLGQAPQQQLRLPAPPQYKGQQRPQGQQRL